MTTQPHPTYTACASPQTPAQRTGRESMPVLVADAPRSAEWPPEVVAAAKMAGPSEAVLA